MAAKKPVTPRIQPQTAELMGTLFNSTTGGSAYVLDSFPGLFQKNIGYALRSLEPEQRIALIHLMERVDLSPDMAGEHIKTLALSGDMTRKLEYLSVFHMACLELWAKAFYIQSGYTIDQYAEIIP